tara:strand:- start:23 stop:247 length:225 start_codon:yes stop_codon:yes gene_type:complete
MIEFSVKLTPEQLDTVVIGELTQTLGYLVDPKHDPYDTFDNKASIVASMCEVLKYYAGPIEYGIIIKTLSKKET